MGVHDPGRGLVGDLPSLLYCLLTPCNVFAEVSLGERDFLPYAFADSRTHIVEVTKGVALEWRQRLVGSNVFDPYDPGLKASSEPLIQLARCQHIRFWPGDLPSIAT